MHDSNDLEFSACVSIDQAKWKAQDATLTTTIADLTVGVWVRLNPLYRLCDGVDEAQSKTGLLLVVICRRCS